MGMEFAILGPLEVRDGDRSVPLTGRQRAILALLLIRRGEPVSPERLIEEFWSDPPPRTAAKSVQVRVSELRRALGDGVVVRRGGGYALELEPGALDLERFERMRADAAALAAAGDMRQASERLR